MKIDPKSLRRLREKQGLTRPQLAERSGINKRTIQRLENEPQQCQKSRKDTLERLAKALGVKEGKEGVLTGELPLPESGKVPDSDPERVQIGAQTVPKVRLAYDLIKHRYGVSATEIINMAPLFFALLAERSLAWRREKLKELKEGIDRLKQIDGFWRENYFPFAVTVDDNDIKAEEDSIDKANLFGEHLLACVTYDLDPSTDNPLASYLRRLISELDITGVVDVDSDQLRFGSPLRFPDYDICRDELDVIANGSHFAKVALETGEVRLSEIPEELMAEGAGTARANWLGDRLPDPLKDQIKIIEALEKRMKAIEKEIKKIDDKIEEMRRPESHPEGVSEEEFKEFLKEDKRQNEHREELGHLEEKHREELSRLEMLITEEKGRSNSDIEKGGDDQ